MAPRLRTLAPLAPLLLLPLAACGDPELETATGEDAYEITSADGAPAVEWKAVLEAGDKDSEVLAEGDGQEVAEGDRILVNVLLSNGFTHRDGLNTYTSEEAGTSLVLEDSEPQTALDLVLDVVKDEIDEGTTVGTRVAVTGGADSIFGDFAHGLGSLGIGNEDGLVMVFDVAAVAADGPEGAKADAPAWAPSILTNKKDVPNGLDFAGLAEPKPKDDLSVATLVEGDGRALAAGDVATVNYLGQVFGADKPFDKSFGGDPFDVGIGKETGGLASSGVIDGWHEGLEGVTVGSRIIIQIPPELGYGETGNEQAGIGGKDTIYFLVDVLGAA